MKFKKAMEIFGINDHEVTKAEFKIIYRRLSLIFHPDKETGDTVKFQKLGEAYEQLQNEYSFRTSVLKEKEREEFEADPNFWYTFGAEMEKAYIVIMNLPVVIEIIGDWLWASGETYPHRELFKEAGFFFSRKKAAWYWREEWKKQYYRRGKYSLEEIREMHGSQRIGKGKSKKAIDGGRS